MRLIDADALLDELAMRFSDMNTNLYDSQDDALEDAAVTVRQAVYDAPTVVAPEGERAKKSYKSAGKKEGLKMTQQENIAELLKLVQENPELPIVPMVDSEIMGDDYSYYAGSWGKSMVDEYIVINDYIAFRGDDDVFDVLERYLPSEDLERLPDSEEECRPLYDALPWTKAIIVYIKSL